MTSIDRQPAVSSRVRVAGRMFRRQRGFSLIEMIAAFLIFAIGMGVLMQVLAGSLRNTRVSANYTQAALWAQSRLDTVGVGEPVEEGHSKGRFDDTYRWELDVQLIDPQSVEPPPQQASLAGNSLGNGPDITSDAGNSGALDVSPVDLYELHLTVFWGGTGDRERHAQFVTLRAANPNAGEGGVLGTAPRGVDMPLRGQSRGQGRNQSQPQGQGRNQTQTQAQGRGK